MDKQAGDLILEQRRLLFGKKRWVVDDASVLAQMNTPTMTFEKRTPLVQLNPEPVRQKVLKLRFLVIAAGVFLLAGFFLISEPNLERRPSNVLFAAWIAILVSIGVAAIARFWAGSQDLVHFYDVFTGRPATSFLNNRPSPEAFSAFIDAFKERIRAARDAVIQKRSASVSTEIERLHGLKEKGILSAEEFERAKARLLDGFRDRRIGFN